MDDQSQMTKTQPPIIRDRFRGCLLAGAVGDALGAGVEFWSLAEILKVFGPEGIRDFIYCYDRVGSITDDTQMTLFTAEGLLRAAARFASRGICHTPSLVHASYLRWLKTQRELARVDVPHDGWLLGTKELWARRAPGNTCLAALTSTSQLGSPAINDSKGCGGVMRVAPVGLLCDPEPAFALGMEIAGLTHGHPTSSCSAGYLACLIAELARGASLHGAVESAKVRLRRCPDHGETLGAVERAQELAGSGTSALSRPEAAARLETLGGGWVAEEALAIALYCVLARDRTEDALILAVNHSGDSDSTGAIAGNIAGVLYGVEALPGQWLDRLELRAEITAVADDLLALRQGRLAVDSEEVRARYPAG